MKQKFLWRKIMTVIDFVVAVICISYLCNAIEDRGWGATWWGFGMGLVISTVIGLGCFFDMLSKLSNIYKEQREFKKAARK